MNRMRSDCWIRPAISWMRSSWRLSSEWRSSCMARFPECRMLRNRLRDSATACHAASDGGKTRHHAVLFRGQLPLTQGQQVAENTVDHVTGIALGVLHQMHPAPTQTNALPDQLIGLKHI